MEFFPYFSHVYHPPRIIPGIHYPFIPTIVTWTGKIEPKQAQVEVKKEKDMVENCDMNMNECSDCDTGDASCSPLVQEADYHPMKVEVGNPHEAYPVMISLGNYLPVHISLDEVRSLIDSLSNAKDYVVDEQAKKFTYEKRTF